MTEQELKPDFPPQTLWISEKALQLTLEDCYEGEGFKYIRAQPVQEVDVEGLKKELVNFLVNNYGFNNPENDAQKLAMLCCDMWTHHLAALGYLKQPQTVDVDALRDALDWLQYDCRPEQLNSHEFHDKCNQIRKALRELMGGG